MFSFSKILKATSLSIALLSSTAIVSTIVTVDYAYAGNGNGNGGGNSGGNSDKGGSDKGSSKSEKSKSKASSAKGKSSDKAATKTRSGKGLLDRLLGRSTSAAEPKVVKQKVAKTKTVKRVATPKVVARAEPAPRTRKLASALGVHPSELGALNATNASPNALKNASPNSRVGRIAAYMGTVEATRALEEQLATAEQVLASIEQPERSIDLIDQAIADTESAKTTLQNDLAALEQELANAAEGEEGDIADQISAKQDEIALADASITELNTEREDAAAYAEAEMQVAELETELANQEGTQREALEAAANKEVTDAVEETVQRMLGIYVEPAPEPETEEDVVIDETTTQDDSEAAL